MFGSQIFDWTEERFWLIFLTNVCLSYIMIEVGLEFLIDKGRWKNYIKDYFVAAFAATLPWIFCFIYFILFFTNNWQESLVIARFAAPTSSGILFSMLAAAGLGTTWLFKKVRILAIFDDVDTILLMVPLQLLLIGLKYQFFFVIFIVIVLLFIAYKYLHKMKLPIGRLWLFGYGGIISVVSLWMLQHFEMEIEVLLPAFVLGCVLHNPHDPAKAEQHTHEHAFLEPEAKATRYFDRGIKILFMLLVGLLIPRIALEEINLWEVIIDVVLITLLSNLGKCIPIFFYRNEASLKERVAVSVGMFPRGEVGGGILVLAIEHGAGGYVTTVAALSLALNLILTWVFIAIVIKLIQDPKNHETQSI